MTLCAWSINQQAKVSIWLIQSTLLAAVHIRTSPKRTSIIAVRNEYDLQPEPREKKLRGNHNGTKTRAGKRLQCLLRDQNIYGILRTIQWQLQCRLEIAPSALWKLPQALNMNYVLNHLQKRYGKHLIMCWPMATDDCNVFAALKWQLL